MQTLELYRDNSALRPNVVWRLAFGTSAISLYLLISLFLASGKADGHEFEDGFVERSVAVVVRDNVARLEYSIGLNPRTRRQLIKFWKSTDGLKGEIKSSLAKDSGSVQQSVDFFQLAADHLSRRLDIVINNQRVKHKFISALRSSRHHVDVTVILEFNLPTLAAQIPIDIEITDGNFFRETMLQEEITPATRRWYSSVVKPKKTMRDEHHLLPAPFGGGFRYALKTAGSTVLSSSNVASILIRADRHLDEDFTLEQLDTALKIKAKVANIDETRLNQ